MVDSVDDKGDDAGQNRERDTDGCDTCSEDDKGPDIPTESFI